MSGIETELAKLSSGFDRGCRDLSIILALGNFVQHRFNMLAGAQLIDLKIGTAANVGTLLQITDGHPVLPWEMGFCGKRGRLPNTEPGFAAQMLDDNLSPSALNPILDSTVGGGEDLVAGFPLVGVSIEHSDHVAADLGSLVGAVALQQQGVVDQRDLDRAGEIQSIVLDLRQEPLRILINSNNPMFLVIAQSFANRLRSAHRFKPLAVKEKRILVLR